MRSGLPGACFAWFSASQKGLFSQKDASSLTPAGSVSAKARGQASAAEYETAALRGGAEKDPSAGGGNGSPASDKPYLIIVNRKQNIVTVYKNDGGGNFTEPVKAMACSVGLSGNTPTGSFKTSDKYTWRLLFGNVYGQYATRITGHILFHSVPYYEKTKDSLKYEEYNKLGSAASDGCIQLCVSDAKWIYDNCPKGTPVEIYDGSADEPLGKPGPVKIDLNDSRRGWDPTDPDPKNPWNG